MNLNRKLVYRDILSYYYENYIFKLPVAERRKYTHDGLFRKLKSIFITLVLSIRERNQGGSEAKVNLLGKRWVFVFGKNNYEATKFLAQAGYIFVTDSRRNFATQHHLYELPIVRRLKYYLPFFNLLIFLYRKEGRRTLRIFDAIFSTMAWFPAFEELLEIYRPSVVVFSNDHSIIPRSLLFAARSKGIPTVYIQHASISRYMPPLVFDLSLLEGNDALAKYKTKGVYGQVKLIGIPRFDRYVKLRRENQSKRVLRVGIAFNTVDSLSRVIHIVQVISEAFPAVEILVRSHPKDKRDLQQKFLKIRHLILESDPRIESPFDFILQCDLLIAGDSSIHLEARMLNIQTVYVDMTESDSTIYDLYGYCETGLVKKIDDMDELIQFMKNPSFEEQVSVKYYNHALGEIYEGNSGKYAIDEIERFMRAMNRS